ncbi:MAG: hypothetical protein H3Z49_04205 [archaeon]|nr:hypothetical protein [archaeon]
MADINDIMKKIPQDSFEEVSEGMGKILLGSKNAEKMPERLAKAILRYFQKDQLTLPEGIRTLLEASMSLEEEKTKDLLQDFGIKIL